MPEIEMTSIAFSPEEISLIGTAWSVMLAMTDGDYVEADKMFRQFQHQYRKWPSATRAISVRMVKALNVNVAREHPELAKTLNDLIDIMK